MSNIDFGASKEKKEKILLAKFVNEIENQVKENGVENAGMDLFHTAELVGIDSSLLDKESDLMYSLWISLLLVLKKYYPPSLFKYKTIEEFKTAYCNRFQNETDSELNKLWHTANWMAILFKRISARKNKGLVMQVIPKVIEGWDAKYITGSGQTRFTSNRVHIFEVEGNTKPNQRGRFKGNSKKDKNRLNNIKKSAKEYKKTASASTTILGKKKGRKPLPYNLKKSYLNANKDFHNNNNNASNPPLSMHDNSYNLVNTVSYDNIDLNLISNHNIPQYNNNMMNLSPENNFIPYFNLPIAVSQDDPSMMNVECEEVNEDIHKVYKSFQEDEIFVIPEDETEEFDNESKIQYDCRIDNSVWNEYSFGFDSNFFAINNSTLSSYNINNEENAQINLQNAINNISLNSEEQNIDSNLTENAMLYHNNYKIKENNFIKSFSIFNPTNINNLNNIENCQDNYKERISKINTLNTEDSNCSSATTMSSISTNTVSSDSFDEKNMVKFPNAIDSDKNKFQNQIESNESQLILRIKPSTSEVNEVNDLNNTIKEYQKIEKVEHQENVENRENLENNKSMNNNNNLMLNDIKITSAW